MSTETASARASEAFGETTGRRPVPLLSLDGHHQVKEFLRQPAQPSHIVHFYEDDGFLCDTIAHFLGAGLAAGESLLVLATAEHREALRQRLQANAFDVERACATGNLVLLDARESLSRFMAGDMPDRDLFEEFIGGLIRESRGGLQHGRVRAYGEMVDLLWRDGNPQAAIRLEEMWDDLVKAQSFSLLCTYVMGNFYKSTDAPHFDQMCQAHTHVIPAENYSRILSPDDRLRQISLLQQRAHALESELEHRRELEQALREALRERGRAEEALRQSLEREKAAREEAERTVRFNEMFAGILGHDLRNPLSAINTGASHILRMNAGEKPSKAAGRILSSAERMARMIEQLLDFTRIRVGDGLALRRTRLDLGDLCQSVKDEFEAAHPESTIVLEAGRNAAGEWDGDRLLQVFSNLVGNAVHHGAPGSEVSLRIDGSSQAEVVALVHNAGAVPADVLPVLFEPFRGSDGHHRTRGLGLGLYITHQIVAAHGGTIAVESTESDGTTFCVRLPRTPPAAHPGAGEARG